MRQANGRPQATQTLVREQAERAHADAERARLQAFLMFAPTAIFVVRGAEPRFLLASATIANPLDLAQRLTGFDDIALIDRDGSPAGRRRIAVWNPPLTDEALGLRRSALAEGAELLARLVADGVRSIRVRCRPPCATTGMACAC